MKRQVLLPLLAFVIALIPGIIFIGSPFKFGDNFSLHQLLYLPLGVISFFAFFLLIKYQVTKLLYATWGFFVVFIIHVFLFYLDSAMYGPAPEFLYRGIGIGTLSALLFYCIAHISSPILRLFTAFLAAAAIIIGYGWWIFG